MELYKIIATCQNFVSENVRTFDFVPENFEGANIMQKFSWVNPMGFTPKFSISTMKAIEDDKVWTDNIFDLYGLESVIEITVYKLNSTGNDYALNSTFLIDFESYLKFDVYSEFALKSISVIDGYNLTKNTDKNYPNTHIANIPSTKNYINFVSLAMDSIEVVDVNEVLLNFIQNDESKIHNSDSALYANVADTRTGPEIVYKFNRSSSGTTTIALVASGMVSVSYADTGIPMTVFINLYKNDTNTLIATIFQEEVSADGRDILSIDIPKTKISNIAFANQDVFFVEVTTDAPGTVFYDVDGSFFVDIYVETEVSVNKYNRYLNYTTSENLLNSIFDNNATIEAELKTIGVASSEVIINSSSYISLKPKDFLSDFCIATGSMINFKLDGSVDIKKISTYFGALLNKANAIEILDFKNLEIGFDTELNFASVSAGMGAQEYDVYAYFSDWNKIITFTQADRNTTENVNLSLSKFRVDISGILDVAQKISSKSTGSQNDLFLFNPSFVDRSASEPYVYDAFTPRDILENWRTFLSFLFYNYDKGTLIISSNGGSNDNLQIAGVNQMDDFNFGGTDSRILPLKVNFSCLTSEIDFSEKILKITHNNVELFIFVTETKTTDNLDEQKIKGNLIFFSES